LARCLRAALAVSGGGKPSRATYQCGNIFAAINGQSAMTIQRTLRLTDLARDTRPRGVATGQRSSPLRPQAAGPPVAGSQTSEIAATPLIPSVDRLDPVHLVDYRSFDQAQYSQRQSRFQHR